MKKNIKNLLASTLLVAGMMGLVGGYSILQSASVHADTTSEIRGGVNDSGGSGAGGDKVVETIKNIINILLFLIGLFAVVMIVIAGFRFVTSNGDSNTVSQAKNTIIYAVIGIVVAVMAYAIVNFVLNQIT